MEELLLRDGSKPIQEGKLTLCFYIFSNQATLVTDFIRTSILLLLAVFLCIKTVLYTDLNGLSGFYDLIIKAEENLPPGSYIRDNYSNSYLTMASPGALQFGVLHTLGNLGEFPL